MMLAAVAVTAASCKDTTEYEWGEDDVTGCYGVYFPAQEASGSHTLDPTMEPTATFTVRRTNTDGAITVPVVATFSDESVFTVSPVRFENGQSETTFTLSFPNAVEGTTYTASFEIQDPQYASKYSSTPVALDYSVLRVKWESFTDPSSASSLVHFNAEWWGEQHDVHIKYYEVNGVRHCVIDGSELCDYPNVGSNGSIIKCKGGLWGNGRDFEFTWDVNSNKINVPKQLLDAYDDKGHYIYAYGMYEFFTSDGGYSVAQLGTPEEFYGKNGASYPQSYYDGNGGFYFNLKYWVPSLGGWTPPVFDLVGVASGYTRVDYSVALEPGQSDENGVLPVQLSLGNDVAKIKYAAYEGTLSATQVASKVASISDGSETNAVEYVPETTSDVIGVTLNATGVYTLVAVTFDGAGKAQQSASVGIDYVAKGDEVPVNVNCGLTVTDKYTPLGFTSENSLEYYVYGKDLKAVKLGLYTQADMADQSACVRSLLSGKNVSDSILTVINTNGACDVISGLVPGTTYYFLVWATNGYQDTIIASRATTNGDPLPVYMNFTYKNFNGDLLPENEKGLYGTYNLYGVDAFKTLGLREYIGKATIADSATPNEGPDEDGYVDEYITIKGLAGPSFSKLGLDDTYEFDFYGGAFYNVSNNTVDGKSEVGVLALGDGKVYNGTYVTIGIPVLDGYYAIVCTPKYADSYNFSGFAFGNEEVDAESFISAYYNYLLVDPAKDDNGLAPKAAAKAAQACKALKKATEAGLDGKAAIKEVLKEISIENVFTSAGVSAEWESASVPVKQVNAVSVPVRNRYQNLTNEQLPVLK